MKKAQLPLFAELDLGDPKDSNTKPTRNFSGAENPRHLRVLNALLIRPRTREEVDRIAGASNSPQLITELRNKGLKIECQRILGVDRDGRAIRYGVYWLAEEDRRALLVWMRARRSRTAS